MLNSATLNVLVLTSESKRKKFGDVIAIKKTFSQPTTFIISLLARIGKKVIVSKQLQNVKQIVNYVLPTLLFVQVFSAIKMKQNMKNRNNLMDRGSI